MAQLFIQLQKPFYFAGQMVSGQVFLNVFQQMAGKGVRIRLKGWETVRWVQTTSVSQEQAQRIPAHQIYNAKNVQIDALSSDSDDSNYEQRRMKKTGNEYFRNEWGQVFRVHRHHGENVLADFKSILYNFGGSYIPPGQYSFPFSFKSGEDWPASYLDKPKNRERKGRIKYQLKTSIQTHDGRRVKDYSYKTEVVVRETVVQKAEEKEIIANVKSCCCIDKGTTKIKCYFDKNGYMPGDEAVIHCQIDNSAGKVQVLRIEVKLINQITYTSSQGHSKVHEADFLKRQFAGVPAGETTQKTQTVKILNDTDRDKFHIKPTSRGRFLKSIYFLRVQAVLDASCTCCSQLPIITQPVLIFPCFNISSVWSQPNWHPQVMPNFTMNMSYTGGNMNIQNMNNPYA